MHLWSDYEGKTIAEAYPLGELIRPEGRSAFFATSNGTGTPSVIRLTESLHDQDEMIERWRQVSELKQDHLVTIRKFGLTNFENTPLAFALMEPSDGSLAEILRERPLTPAETREVAVSLVDALRALHENDLVHEHVEASNVMAVGEVVKLRSDCVRECKPDSEFLTVAESEELKRMDVQALAGLLLQALTLERSLKPGIKIPAPFDKIVMNGMDGSWGLQEIDAALNPPVVKPVEARPLVPESVLLTKTEERQQALPLGTPVVAPDGGPTRVSAMPVRRAVAGVEPVGRPLGFWLACAVGLLLVLVLGWKMIGGKEASAPVAAAPVASPAAPTKFTPIDEAPNPKTISGVVAPPLATASTQAGWHVVAFTYNHPEQALAKVAAIRERHPGLSPEVFAPNGRAPYLVALGGAMSERDADGMKAKARKDGMPRDTFVRRFGAQ